VTESKVTTKTDSSIEVATPSNRLLPPSGRARTASITSTIFTKMLYHKEPKSEMKSSGAWVIGVAFIEHDAGFSKVRDVIQRLVTKYARFRSTCKMQSSHKAVFEEIDGELDWDYHIPDLAETTRGWTQADVYAYLNEVGDFDYDLDKPLWRYLYIPKLVDGRAVLISCINHAIGDGLAIVAVSEELYDPRPPATTASESPKNFKHQGKKPPQKKLDFWTKLGIFLYGLYHGATVPFSRADPQNPLKLPKGEKPLGKKVLALAEPISLDKVKEIKNKMEGTTINDVLMGLMTMTLKSFFIEENRYRPGEKVTAQFPISMRGVGEGGLDMYGEPHNKVSYAYFDFNFEGSREDIIWHTKQQIDCIKHSPSPLMINLNLQIGARLLPYQLIMDLVSHAANLGTAQLSNVPAPQTQMTIFNGVKVLDMNFFLFSPLACYLGILTYNGIVNAAFNLDSGLKIDPHKLAKHWNAEFENLYREVVQKVEMNHGEPLKEPKHDTSFYQNLAKVTVALLGLLLAYCVVL